MPTDSVALLKKLRALGSKERRESMLRFGVVVSNAHGIAIPTLRNIAKTLPKNHVLAKELWASGNHEARILAALIDEAEKVSQRQMDQWAGDFRSWDLCDQVCGNLFDRTPFAFSKAKEWTHHQSEFVRRAGFSLMACLAVHDKKAIDSQFLPFFPLIEQYAHDERNFVKKAVNWALRQIGKRNVKLHKRAIKSAERILKQNTPSARWIAHDALRELNSEAVQKRYL